jgi:hypothetical protein
MLSSGWLVPQAHLAWGSMYHLQPGAKRGIGQIRHYFVGEDKVNCAVEMARMERTKVWKSCFR